MKDRPDFTTMKTYQEFSHYYWYRTELADICKQLGLEYSGIKTELEEEIKQYFAGNVVQKKVPLKTKKKQGIELTLDTPLLSCDFAFNTRFREFFAQQTGVSSFKFTADMAAAWRKVKAEKDVEFTLRDMLAIYQGQSTYAKYDNTSCQWNQFVKDFCADKNNAAFQQKLKVAAILWQKVKHSTASKVYHQQLVKNYWDDIFMYLKGK
ncbi:SAP domain-containing protein [Streptococcus constellatus]|uniref:SAP domain-containing protein n=1 Tax=Streptococcus TaxID=1301 RepID=UPI000F70074F|nr:MULTISPECIES: SAP domain-containing protein [Streptococcus]MBW3451672.1 SAP domain-containing protein [Streptococcus constellatus]VEE81269.1 cytoplasmic protein [Streptococcus milleri]